MKPPLFPAFVCLSVLTFSPIFAQDAVPPTSVPLDETVTPVFEDIGGRGEATTDKAHANFRLFLEYDSTGEAKVLLGDRGVVDLPAGKARRVEIAYEDIGTSPARLRTWIDGKQTAPARELVDPAEEKVAANVVDEATSDEVLRLDRDFTVMVKMKPGKQGGTLVAKAPAEGKWVAGGKSLFVRDGRLVYDIGWKGEIMGQSRITGDKEHVVVLVAEGGRVSFFLDGKPEGGRENFTAADPDGAVFKIGSTAPDFGGDFDGKIKQVRFWRRALDKKEIRLLSRGKDDSVNTPDYDWNAAEGREVEGIRPTLAVEEEFKLHRAFVQPLALADHAEIVDGWWEEAYARGEKIYSQLCVTCHGTLDEPGSLPTAPRFHLGEFKNGGDPYRMLQTLEKGYGQMVPQPQYTTAQKYDVIYYLREHFLKGRNEDQLVAVDDEYLRMLPRGMTLRREEVAKQQMPPYLVQDFGNVLFWTFQVEPDNFAQKGIAVRLDEGPGGISQGRAWMLYDQDTMRVAACWTGEQFVDWRGIAFDGSHGTHTGILGEQHFVFPNEPMWANPATGDFKDLRILGRDGKPYGPLPREWVHFKGLEWHNKKPLVRYTVGDCEIREVPGLASGDSFERHFYCGPTSTELKLRLDAERTHVFPATDKPFRFTVHYFDTSAEVVAGPDGPVPGEPVSKRLAGTVTSKLIQGEEDGPWAVDVMELPALGKNPWHSWMRVSGFDFFEGAQSAAVCTWNGDVWIVDGIDQAEGDLKWQRICSGLFQPLGLKILDGEIYVSCRDMIAVLRDYNGDRETDFIESFNNDHQVTEHFHEFAMGLQADDEGNLYYAKSARHAKTPVVPHHGTLLKVSKDGSKTEILATGFRAANGVCLNPDGSFIVTDQEGHWNPKNRINWVQGQGTHEFYGNMWGYHDVTDESDEAMIQPLCWITNAFDRSPAELMWVPENSAWKPLRGSLINLSYGAGRIYTVPFEQKAGGVQGGMAAFPLEPFPTGVMRGRFSPRDGELYACGMFAWAGNRHEPGGFYRVRYTGKPAHQPIDIETAPDEITLTFSDPLDPASVADPSAWKIRAWDLKRTRNYGSKHYNEREWPVSKARLSDDGCSAVLTIPDLAPTWGMSIRMNLRGSKGEEVVREMHNSIFNLE